MNNQKKISKHSLLTIALAVMLAISMALTATFAAYSSNSIATGTITFKGGVTTAIAKGSSGFSLTGSGTSVVFSTTVNDNTTLNSIATNLGAITVSMTAQSDNPAYVGIKVVASAGGSSSPITVSPKEASQLLISSHNYYYDNTRGIYYAASSAGLSNAKAVESLDATPLSSFYTISKVDANLANSPVTFKIEIFASMTKEDFSNHNWIS